MIPNKFIDISGQEQAYFSKQYPETSDCIKLDKQMRDIAVDLDKIVLRDLENTNEGAPIIGKVARVKSKSILNEMLLKKTNQFNNIRCRDKIETQRQDESAKLFSDTAGKADKAVLGQSNKKQLAYVLLGSTLFLASLYFFTRGRSKD